MIKKIIFCRVKFLYLLDVTYNEKINFIYINVVYLHLFAIHTITNTTMNLTLKTNEGKSMQVKFLETEVKISAHSNSQTTVRKYIAMLSSPSRRNGRRNHPHKSWITYVSLKKPLASNYQEKHGHVSIEFAATMANMRTS